MILAVATANTPVKNWHKGGYEMIEEKILPCRICGAEAIVENLDEDYWVESSRNPRH
jgi:hypothetical protein